MTGILDRCLSRTADRGALRGLVPGAGALLASAALALAVAAPAQAAPQSPTDASPAGVAAEATARSFPAKTDLNGRQRIGDAADAPGVVVDKYRAGQDVPVECQQEHGGAIWDRTSDGLWVPDEYVKTGYDGMVPGMPRCDADSSDDGRRAPGIDVSNHNGSFDASGQEFVYVKATEGTTYVDPTRAGHVKQARDEGARTGGYHFAWPNGASGADQADYFIDNGGGWTADGKTLPGALDLEDTASQPHCYGLDDAQMVSFIGDFSDRYQERTGRLPVIYTTASWWNDCTGGSAEFADHPLWIANYHDDPSDPGPMPEGFDDWTIYQYTEKPLDKNVFHGGEDAVQKLADG